jgi:predicted transporter
MLDLRTRALIARSVGIVAIALGFVSGIYGLEHTETMWLRTALGLLVTGMLAQGYAMYCSIKWMREKPDVGSD